MRNCTTCNWHHVYGDDYGFDGCTCSGSDMPIHEESNYHKWCDETGWRHGFDPDTMDCNCQYYEQETCINYGSMKELYKCQTE